LARSSISLNSSENFPLKVRSLFTTLSRFFPSTVSWRFSQVTSLFKLYLEKEEQLPLGNRLAKQQVGHGSKPPMSPELTQHFTGRMQKSLSQPSRLIPGRTVSAQLNRRMSSSIDDIAEE
jgi:hypothetical protein